MLGCKLISLLLIRNIRNRPKYKKKEFNISSNFHHNVKSVSHYSIKYPIFCTFPSCSCEWRQTHLRLLSSWSRRMPGEPGPACWSVSDSTDGRKHNDLFFPMWCILAGGLILITIPRQERRKSAPPPSEYRFHQSAPAKGANQWRGSWREGATSDWIVKVLISEHFRWLRHCGGLRSLVRRLPEVGLVRRDKYSLCSTFRLKLD